MLTLIDCYLHIYKSNETESFASFSFIRGALGRTKNTSLLDEKRHAWWQHRTVSGHRSPPSCHRVPRLILLSLIALNFSFARAIFSGLREKFHASLIVIVTAQDYTN